MGIKKPSVFNEIATEIATSWNDIGSNFVLVAPPLCEPDYIFKLLRDPRFQKSLSINPDKLALAYLPPSSYNSPLEFIRRALQCWNIGNTDEPFETAIEGELEVLEDALSKLQDQGKVAVILLPQFHKSIEKLSWTLGARLRELEINFNLCTVVELPIPLSQLRDRWQLIDDKENFICSDFGQGHSVVTLTGYKKDEIDRIGKDLNLKDECIDIIQRWSGGLPALVKWLAREANLGKNSFELENIAKKGSVEQSKRFLDWVDTPETNTFKAHIADLSRGIDGESNRLALREHVWSSLLIDKKGKLLPESVGYACRTIVSLGCSQSLVLISDLVNQGKRDNVTRLANTLSEACKSEAKTKIILAIIPVWELTTILSPEWKKIETAAKKGLKELRAIKDTFPHDVISSLERWKDFSSEIHQYQYEEELNKDKDWRLSDSLSGRSNGSDLAAIQLVIYRLRIASKNPDKNAAMKSILEIPEQILQIYCGRKLKISVWEAPNFTTEEVQAINVVWTSGKFLPPPPKSRIGFTQLLFIGWIKMQLLDEKERLFVDFDELAYWQETYAQKRNQPSHSITLETEADWEDFYQNCMELAKRLAVSLIGDFNDEILPALDTVIALVANNGSDYD